MTGTDPYAFQPADDCYHRLSDDPYETETNWWSWNVPERKIGGWIHTPRYPNRGDGPGGCVTWRIFVWDQRGYDVARMAYYKKVEEVAMPADPDLRPAGSPIAENVSGGNGIDEIACNGIGCYVFGDSGNDVIVVNVKYSSVSGGVGNDQITLNRSGSAWGEDGNDQINGSANDDLLDGGIGNDTLNGNDGDDDLIGIGGNDTLNGGTGEDNLQGGDDVDSCDGGLDSDTDTAAGCESTTNVP